MCHAMLILALLAAEPAGQQELLKTFRSEFVQLTPGSAGFPARLVPGDTSGGEVEPDSRRSVAIGPFAIARYEMPQNLYEAVAGENPSRWKGPRNSVEVVSYADAEAFCQKATRLMREAGLIEPGQVIRLPSELEWEYACKAGSTTKYSFGDEVEKLDDYAWHTGNAAGNDPPVGAKKPNAWGLYDMHGYLWEWTSTPWPAEGPAADEGAGERRVIRGGSWRDGPAKLASHFRAGAPASEKNDALGFRCVLAQADDAAGEAAAAVPTEFKPTAQERLVPAGARVELLWNEGEFTEGPAWSPEGYLLFSDIGTRIYRYNPSDGEVTVFREPSGKANGLAFDDKGRLIACEGAAGGNRRVSITEADATVRTLAGSFRGKRFNSPNDLALDPAGNVYFTDPRYGGDEPRQLDFEGVFLVATDGQVRLATGELSKPNGIVITADGRRAYVADHDSRADGPRHLVRFDVALDATLKNKQVLYDFGAGRGIDGMTLDAAGNLYATAGRGEQAGIYVFGPEGEHLALIPLPGDPTNCTFGGGKWKTTLFITAQGPAPAEAGGQRKWALYKIDLTPPRN